MLTSTTNKRKQTELLRSTDSFATTLLTIVLDLYGTEALSWDMLTIDKELEDDYGVELPRLNRDKLQAIMTVITTDQFYNDWVVFNTTCEALNNDPVDFEKLDPATPEQMGWAITEALLLEDAEERPEFDPEVLAYMGAILALHGVSRPPDVLRVAQMPAGSNDPGVLADDPIMYQGYYQRQDSDNEEIMDYIRERLAALIEQLDEVPLENRDEQSWKAFQSKFASKLAGLQNSD